MRISLPGTERSVAGALRTCCRPSLVALKWRFEPYAKSIGWRHAAKSRSRPTTPRLAATMASERKRANVFGEDHDEAGKGSPKRAKGSVPSISSGPIWTLLMLPLLVSQECCEYTRTALRTLVWY
jgi:hypothetical protein